MGKISTLLRKFKYQIALSSNSIEDRFTNIYKNDLWYRNKESKSGAGSTLAATLHLRDLLPKYLKEIKAKNLIDIGCGDFNWMKKVDLPCKYLGIDIVKSVIDENQENYANKSILFQHANMVNEPLSAESDVVLCREVLFHLSFEDGIKMLTNIINSNARFLIITTDEKVQYNQDIKTGSFRNINLKRSPFNFPESIFQFEDNQVSDSRSLAVWPIEQLKSLTFDQK